MTDYTSMTDKQIRKIWYKNTPKTKGDLYNFRAELVKRGFVSEEELNNRCTIEK